jgi:hypothetical protein
MKRVMLVFAAFLLVGACSKDEEKGEKAKSGETKPAPAKAEAKPESEGTAFHEGVVAALKKAGLDSTPFEQAASRPYEAKHCARAEVGKLDVLLCEFEGEPAAKAGEKKLEEFVSGAVSGAVRRSKSLVLAVADRKKADLKGEGINKLLKAFQAM